MTCETICTCRVCRIRGVIHILIAVARISYTPELLQDPAGFQLGSSATKSRWESARDHEGSSKPLNSHEDDRRCLPILKILKDRQWSKRFLKESGKPERIIATLELFQRILKESCKNPEKSLKNVKMKKFLSILTILKDRKRSKRIRKSWNPVRIPKTQRSWKNHKNPG